MVRGGGEGGMSSKGLGIRQERLGTTPYFSGSFQYYCGQMPAGLAKTNARKTRLLKTNVPVK